MRRIEVRKNQDTIIRAESRLRKIIGGVFSTGSSPYAVLPRYVNLSQECDWKRTFSENHSARKPFERCKMVLTTDQSHPHGNIT
jgi:hypothetical protein